MANTDPAVVAVLERVKLSDGSYGYVLPINTTDEVYTDFKTKETLTTKLLIVDSDIKTILTNMIEDHSKIMSALSSLFPEVFSLNNIVVDKIAGNASLNVESGVYLPGKIII